MVLARRSSCSTPRARSLEHAKPASFGPWFLAVDKHVGVGVGLVVVGKGWKGCSHKSRTESVQAESFAVSRLPAVIKGNRLRVRSAQIPASFMVM